MATIPTYPNLSPLTGTELIVISDVNNDNVTRTATVQQILDLTGSGVGNLQAVLTVGSDATSNMKLTGDFTLVGTLGANKVNAAGGDSNFSTIGNLTPGTIIGTDFQATGTGTFDTTLDVTGVTTLAGLNAGDTTANSLVIDNGSSLQGTLTVGGVTTSNATFNDDLTVAATGTFSSSDVSITGGSIDGTDIGVTVTGDIFGDNIVNTDVNNDITPKAGGGLLPSSIGGVGSMTWLEYANDSNLNIEFTASNPAAAADYFTHTTPTFFKFTSFDVDAANIGIEVNNGLVELTGLSNDISDIDAGIDKTLTTKEWVEAQITISTSTLRNVTTTDTFTTAGETINCTSGTFTVNLPTAVGIQGTFFQLVNSGLGTITLDPNGTETINGSPTISLITQYTSRTVQSDGANWIVI